MSMTCVCFDSWFDSHHTENSMLLKIPHVYLNIKPSLHAKRILSKNIENSEQKYRLQNSVNMLFSSIVKLNDYYR